MYEKQLKRLNVHHEDPVHFKVYVPTIQSKELKKVNLEVIWGFKSIREGL